MDNHIFRSAIGGFNRQDVMEYIERTQKQSEESTVWLESQVEQLQQSENEAQTALRECTEERDRLAAELEEMTAKYNNAKNNWESQAQAKESSRRDVVQRDKTIRDMTEENQQLFHRLQELESEMSDFQRQKEQLIQMELDAHRRADAVIADAEARAKEILTAAEAKAGTITASAEERAQITTANAKDHAERMVSDAESVSESIVRKTKLCIEDTAEDFKEVLQDFQTVSGRIAEELKRMERTMGEFPVGLNGLQKDLEELYGHISEKEAEMQGRSTNGESGKKS